MFELNRDMKFLILSVIIFCGILLLMLQIPDPEPEVVVPPTTSYDYSPQFIEEDEPGWNCITMGNMICGPLHEEVEVGGADEKSTKEGK